MHDQEFFDDLAMQLRKEFDVQEPQTRDEFTALWFAENVTSGRYNREREFLEKRVKAGVLIVRRHVRLTWGRTQGRGAFADVYRMAKNVTHNTGKTRRKRVRYKDLPAL